MRKIWMKKFETFKKAEKEDRKYYSNMTPAERLSIVQFLRELYSKMKRGKKYECTTRLRRVIKIIQQV